MSSLRGFTELSRIIRSEAVNHIAGTCRVRPSLHVHSWSHREFSSFSRSKISKHADVLIIGGGAMGSSAAYFLKSKSPSTKVVVVERDPKVLFEQHCRLAQRVKCYFSLYSSSPLFHLLYLDQSVAKKLALS